MAITVGCLTALPQILAIQNTDNFQGIYKQVNNDEIYYMARARDIVDGHSYLSNPYIYEYKNGQPMQFWLPDYLMAKPLAFLHINIYKGYIFYDFLLPFILTLLTYAIIYKLTDSKPISIIGAAFLHLNLFFNVFNRAPSPQLIFIFWQLLFLLWLRFIEKPTNINAGFMGIAFGLLFHIYPYYWTFYVIFFALYLFFNFVLKKNIDYKKYFLAFAIAFVISIPYFISFIKSMQSTYYNESVARVGMLDTHFPTGRKIVMWGALTLILFAITHRKKIVDLNGKSLLLAGSCLAAIIAVNQQVITGKNLQFASHYWMLGVFCFVFMFLYLFDLALKNKNNNIPPGFSRSLKNEVFNPGLLKSLLKQVGNKKINFFGARLIILALVGIYLFYNPFVYAANALSGKSFVYTEREIKSQRFAEIFRWLNDNTSADEVVFSDMELSSLIPVYTSNNVFYCPSAGLFFVPSSELWERFILNNYWQEFNEEYVEKMQFVVWGAYYQTKYDNDRTKNKLRKALFLPQKEYVKIPPEEIEKFLTFADEVKSENFAERLKKYRVDYFVYDKENDNWPVEKLDFLEPIFEVNGIVIYKVL